jgi:Mg-chelatase subunit ChlD
MIALLWAAAGAFLLAAVALLIRRGRREPVLEVADAGSFDTARRRTLLLWGSLAAALLTALVVFAVQARAQPEEAPILRPGADAVIVIDLSGSALSSSKGIARVLLELTRDPRRHLGLVVFSDVAYEALPPSTPVEGLKGWLELFTRDDPWNYPWAPSFASGTTISSGLVLARKILRRDRVEHPHVVLVSDLADAESDLQRLELVMAQYQRERIDLSVVRVRPGVEPPEGPVSGLPNASFVAKAATQTVDPSHSARTDVGPIVLAALVALLGLLAVANELALQPLTWGART